MTLDELEARCKQQQEVAAGCPDVELMEFIALQIPRAQPPMGETTQVLVGRKKVGIPEVRGMPLSVKRNPAGKGYLVNVAVSSRQVLKWIRAVRAAGLNP